MSKTPSTLDLDYFERVILLNALTNQEYLSSVIRYLQPELFNDKNIAVVVNGIIHFFEERGTLPSLTELKARLGSESEKKALNEIKSQLNDLDSSYNKEELIFNTEKFLKERFVYKTILDVAEKFTNKNFKLEEALAEFEKAYNITLKENLGHWYFEDVDKHIEELTAIYNPTPTGWKFFDEKTEGGLFPKTLTVFAGQVNVGKSIVLGNIATNMLQNEKNVLLISLEMSEFMYAKRISTQLTQIPHNDLKLYTNELKDQLIHIKNKLQSKLVIKEYPPKTVTVRHIDSFITKLVHKGFKPDIVVVDYINLIQPTSKNLNSYESVKEIAEQLRGLSFKYNIPIVSATQLNRGSFNTSSPGMEGIAESIGLAATADVICSLWQDEESRELGVINMGMQKNRFGPNFGHGAFKCNYNTLTLKETNPDYFEEDNSKEENVINNIDKALSTLTNE
jgi:replicative DNA helicase